MPHRIALLMTSLLLADILAWEFLKKLVTRWLMSVRTISVSGKIFLTVMMIRRRHGQAGYQTGPKGGRPCRGPLPEPAPGAGDRPGYPPNLSRYVCELPFILPVQCLIMDFLVLFGGISPQYE